MRRRDHLAGAVDVVVISVDLDQTRVGFNAIHIVVHRAVLGDNAAFRMINRLGRIDHLAILAEVIKSSGQEIVGSIHPVVLRCDHLAGAVDVVVISVDLD